MHKMELNILILTLSTGEEVICNLKDHVEEVNGTEQKVCYNMVYPFTIRRTGALENSRVSVTFTPWKFFSSDTSFLIGYDKIMNMCTPLPNITEEYKRAVDAYIKTLVEQQQ